jgi:AcrR family transcriptional regulator
MAQSPAKRDVIAAPEPLSDRLSIRREAILVQAAQLFAEHGYSNCDTQLLAESIGVGKGTVYRYFSSKRELFLAAADRVMRMLREHVEARIGDEQDPLERIRRGIGGFLAFFAEHPGFVELLMQERAQFKDRTRPTFIEHRQVNVARWRDLYRSLICDGRVRDIPVERITDVVGNLLYGTIFTNYFSGSTKSPEDQAQDILDVVFNGILTASERQQQSLRRQSEINAPGCEPHPVPRALATEGETSA